MATTNKRFVAKNGLDNNGNTITNVGASGNSLGISGTGDLTITISGTATLTVPSGSDTLVTLTGIQTLTNKTLTAPVIATISNTGTLTLPTSTDTLVGRATTDTLTNKTISGSNNTLSNIGNSSLTNSSVSYNGVSVALGASGTLYTDDISEDGSPVNLWFTDTRARNAISVTDSGGDGSLSYNSGTGVITYTGPSAAEVRAHLSAGTGLTYTSGQFAIDSTVTTLTGTQTLTNKTLTTPIIAEIDNSGDIILDAGGDIILDADGADVLLKDGGVTFGAFSQSGSELLIKSGITPTTALTLSGQDVVVAGNLTVSGTTFTVNSNTVNIGDNIITLNSDETGTPSQDGGIEIERGTSTNVSLLWDESNDKWTVGNQTFVAGTFEGSLTGNAGTATTLATGRTISMTGDVSWTSESFNGSANVTGTSTLANSGVTAGTYTKVTVDAKGRITVGASLASGDLPTYTGSLTSGQVTTALGFTPYDATNPSGYTTNTGTVTSVSGTGTVNGLSLSGTVTTSGSLTLGGTLSLTSGQVTDALGYTPYNSSNPAGYITSSASISGNAATATKLETARNINGVAFDGSANITVADSTKLPLAGGTMTGAIAMSGTQTITFAGFAGVEYYNTSGTWEGYIGTENNAGNVRYNSRQGTHTWYANSNSIGSWNASALNSLVAIQQGGNQVLHAGNFTSYALTAAAGSNQTVNLQIARWNVSTNNRVMNTDPRWNESGYDADLGVLHIWASKADGTNYGRAGFALYNDNNYQYITTKTGQTGIYINNNLAIHAGNYSSYALPLSGGTLTGTLYFTNTTNGLSQSSSRLIVRSESTDNVAQFASYGLFLPQTGQIAGLYAQSPIEARAGLRIGTDAGSGTITVGATTAGTANRIVQRDGNSNIFVSGVGSNAWAPSSPNETGRVVSPGGGAASWDDTKTGAIKIRLPFRNSNAMWRITVKIYDYSFNYVAAYDIGNYSYSDGGYNSSAYFTGSSNAPARVVRWGNDGTYDCVWIGETDSLWSYPLIAITDYQSGFRNSQASSGISGWDISFVTSFGTVQTSTLPVTRLATSSTVNGNLIIHAGNYTNYPTTFANLNSGGVGYREDYSLGFRPSSAAGTYAGFRFGSPGNDADAGYFLIRGGVDNDVYTQNGLTIVADLGWLTLAQRTTAGKGVRIMTGTTTSTTRLLVDTSGAVSIGTTVRSATRLTVSSTTGAGQWAVQFSDDVNYTVGIRRWDTTGTKAFIGGTGGTLTLAVGVNDAEVLLVESGVLRTLGFNRAYGYSLLDGTNSGGFFKRKTWLGGGSTDESPIIAAETGLGIYFATNGSAATKMFLSTGGVLNLYNELIFNSTSNIRSDNQFQIVTIGGGAQTARFGGIQVGSSYSGTVPTNGILFGSDTTLTRIGAGHLQTSGEFSVSNWIYATTSGYGVYWSPAGAGIYSLSSNSYLQFYGATPGGIAFRTGGYSGTTIGYVYYDSVAFGLLWGGGWSVRCISGGGELYGNWSTTGNFTASGNVTAYSDVRLKTNINTLTNSLEKVLSMRGVSYTRTDVDTKKLQIGVIAQEIEQILPEVISENENGIKSVSYGNIVGILIEAIKELKKELDEVKSQHKH